MRKATHKPDFMLSDPCDTRTKRIIFPDRMGGLPRDPSNCLDWIDELAENAILWETGLGFRV